MYFNYYYYYYYYYYTFCWQGKSSDEPYEHGVGFAARNSLLNMVELGSSAGGSE